MDRADVKIITHETPYQGYFRIDRYRLQHRCHDGDWTPILVREVFERGQAVAVLPYDPSRDQVVLIEQFRIGAYAASEPCWVTEIVAGVIEEGEEPETVAWRETVEETGCVISDLIEMGKYLSSPGGSSETVRLYVGRVDTQTAIRLCGLPEEGEDIRVLVKQWAEVRAALYNGTISGSASAVIALQWLELNFEQVLRRWRSPTA